MQRWSLRLGASPRVVGAESETLTEARNRLIEVVHRRGHLVFDEPVRLASGDWSRHFFDGKRALSRGRDLRLAAQTILDFVEAAGVTFNAVGGLTLGADHFAHAVAYAADDDANVVEWFTIRKHAKDRGTKRRVEGAQLPELGSHYRVLLVDDVVTRGGSIIDAYEAITETRASVVCAVALLDRGADEAPEFFAARNIPYLPLVRHSDIDMPKIGTEEGVTSAAG